MAKIKGVTIDKCVIGREYWLDLCMNDVGKYSGDGKWIPVSIKYYPISDDGLVRLNSGLFYPKEEIKNK